MSSSIDIHADDYALSENSDNDILKLCAEGFLDSISIIPNLSCFEDSVKNFLAMQKELSKRILVSVHLNFMEGKCCAPKEALPDLVDSNGFFKVSWGKLFLWNYIPFIQNKIKCQLKIEISAQIRRCTKAGIIEKHSVRIDSHQHPHMIPLVFKALQESVTELENEGIKIEYIRNTEDPVKFYHGKDIFSLNTIKCLILNFYSRRVKKYIRCKKIQLNYLCGVYFSGKMDSRIKAVITRFKRRAEKENRVVELLFHPGIMLKSEITDEFTKTEFNAFHLSANRKLEFSTLKELYTYL